MIIFINGSINSGKSTVAKFLVKKIPKAALLEVDVLRDMIEWMPLDQAVPINLANAAALIKNFINKEINVIVPCPLSEKNYNYLISELKNVKTDIYVFTLAPKLEKILINRGARELDKWEQERIKYHYNIGIHKPSFGEIIDNSEQTPEETVNYILRKLK